MPLFNTRHSLLMPLCIYALVCIVLWMVPLFNLLHVESSAVIAGVSFFVAGLCAIKEFRQKTGLSQAIFLHLLLLFTPWCLLTLSLFWQDNCGYWQGLLFFLIFTVPSVLLAVSFAYFIHAGRYKWKKTIFVGGGLFMAIGGVVYDLGFHSQFFTYNHVFGGIVGPIYDEELSIRSGLLFFRLRSVLLALWFGMLGRQLQMRRTLQQRFSFAIVGLLIALSYVFAAQLRINTPAWFIKNQLGGYISTEHFDIYYDEASTDSLLKTQLVDEHEFRYHFIKQKLGIDVNQKIQSFIYPDTRKKDWLTGSKNTSVAPVWLSQPQMHILGEFFEYVFPHELAHVFSREFGLPILNASLSVGLVEGLAVALEPADGRPSPHEQVLTAVALLSAPGRELDIESSIGLADRLTPLGFWTGRGAVSYTTMGSFVNFLADSYGYEKVMQVYARSNFEEVFGKSISDLVSAWETHLLQAKSVDRSSHAYVTRRFAIPSLFEKACPHYLPAYEKNFRKGEVELASGDTLSAMKHFELSLEEEPAFEKALNAWTIIKLINGEYESVINSIEAFFVTGTEDNKHPSTALIWMRYGNALGYADRPDEATAAYDSAQIRLPQYAHQQKGFIELRKSLVYRDEVQEILGSGDIVAQKVSALDGIFDSGFEVKMLQAVLLMVNEQYSASLEYLNDAEAWAGQESPILINPGLKRLHKILQATMNYYVGNLDLALQQARDIQGQFEAIGAFNSAMQFADFADRMGYIVQQ